MPRKYELTATITADDFESMLNLLHVVFQGIAAGAFYGTAAGYTGGFEFHTEGPMEELKHEYLSYRDAADEEA